MSYQKLINRIKKMVDQPVTNFNISGAVTDEPVAFDERLNLSYKSFEMGQSWGVLFSCAWFNLTTKLDPSGNQIYWLKLDMNCEALLFDKKGTPLKGFTNGSSAFGSDGSLGSPAKRYYPLTEFIQEDGSVSLWVDAGMNDLFGNVKKEGCIEIVQVVHRNQKARTLYYDLKALVSMRTACQKYDKKALLIYTKGLKQINSIVNKRKDSWLEQALDVSKKLLSTPTKQTHEVSLIGHAHLDLAWLWPIRETHRKGARTFANVLRLMETYEDFIFGASQPQLYQWVKEQYPSLYKQIKERVKEGRWEVQGGMWVEADTNISGEEALVRQMLYGTRFFKREFNVQVNSLWLPDVFGYSGNIPQIVKKSGIDNFMTNKMSWNDTNKFPYHTFNWQGIDGSEILTHMPPDGDYNSPANADFLLKSMNNYREKHINQQSLSLFGVGDGGGGPGPSHMERIRRLGGCAPMPKVTMTSSATFFEKLSKIRGKFPSYKGELYLEKHRGTYTSQGRIKYYNRKMQEKLKTIETLLVQTERYKEYKSELESIWKEVLLYQFHDILPGSSIKRVYDECIARYEILMMQLDQIIEVVLEAKLLKDADDCSFDVINVYNPLLNKVTKSRETDRSYQLITIEPMSNNVINKKEYLKEKVNLNHQLENNMIKVKFDSDGSIVTIFDKSNHRTVLKGKGNRLRVYKDIANAWDIHRYYRLLPSKKMILVKTEQFVFGDIKQMVQNYTYGQSTLKQTITLKPDSRLLEFELDVQWSSLKRMFRTSFPLNLTTDKAIFDIQFGHIERSTRNNTKILRAQYEASGHNWIDMNNGDWGVALITDCKYGFRAKNNTLDLNLIKSTNYPAKSGDIGHHKIKYGLFIHEGDHIESQVDEVAMAYNTYMPVTTSKKTIHTSLFKVTGNNITYSTVKLTEEGDDIIFRLYERNGVGDKVTITYQNKSIAIYETNMVEENDQLISENNVAELDFTPFEVKTIKVVKTME